ncbi:ABC transporter permease [Mycoplasma sp. Pen4]|uniref:ABC transporter permease n=1 Tax=Mycoplasma sp. Pen4 TaxID=640330 RepID=UPI0016544EA0|nr:ABC transporter permease [Mycoplasma sp. Pen4]QNM93448.1 ABC transporter permease [Mycoplasma sp. Pen4]
MNAKEFEKKYNLNLNGSLRSTISSFAAKDDANLNNIAGKPKKIVIEIFKRFFSSWSAVVGLIVFLGVLLASIIITSTSFYSSTNPIYDDIKINVYDLDGNLIKSGVASTAKVISLPPTFEPFVIASPYSQEISIFNNSNFYGGAFKVNDMDLFNHAGIGLIKDKTFRIDENKTLYIDIYNFLKMLNISAALDNAGFNPATTSKADAIKLAGFIIQNNPQLNLATILGTNDKGLDIWTTSWVGTWQAIRLAIIVATIQTIIGVTVGAYLGFHVGSWIDTVMMRLIDIFVAPPTLIWLLIFATTFGTTDLTLGFALVFVGWVGSVGRTRMFIITVKDSEFITASKSVGASKARLIYKHALPGIVGKIATSYVASIPSIIMSVSSLAFLGFFKSDQANLGAILSSAASQASTNVWILALPATILLLISVSLHFVALGVHDALDPKVIKSK